MTFRNPQLDLLPRYPVIIGDVLSESGSGPTRAHVYPANGRVTREIVMAGEKDVDAAVGAAREALPAWRHLTGDRRRDLMLRVAVLLEENTEALALLGTIENGASAIMGTAIPAVGGRLVAGGTRLDEGEYADGFFLPLTVIADVDNDSAIAQNEVFGPVLTVTPFDTEDEAIALANGTDYGLGGYIHTIDLRRAHYVAARLDAGMIQVNGSGEGMAPAMPFGGMKQSGYGRLGGAAGLHEFLQTKNVWINLAAPAVST